MCGVGGRGWRGRWEGGGGVGEKPKAGYTFH